MLRRTLLSTAALVLVASCADQGGILGTAAQALGSAGKAADDIDALVVGVQGGIDRAKGLAASAVTKVSGWLTQLKSISAKVRSVASDLAAQPLVQQAEDIWSQVSALLGPVASSVDVVLPATATAPAATSKLSSILQAASSLIPVIKAAVGIAMMLARPVMAPDQARLVLARAAAR